MKVEATMSTVLDLVSSTANMAVTADIVPKDAWSTIAAAAPVEQERVKYVADGTGATVSTAVSTTAHAKTMTTCAAEGVMPTCWTRLVLNSGIAAVAPTTGGQGRQTRLQLAAERALTADKAAVSVQPVIIVVGSAFAASTELGVAAILLILAPSLRNTYHPAYLMRSSCRSVDHAARRQTG